MIILALDPVKLIGRENRFDLQYFGVCEMVLDLSEIETNRFSRPPDPYLQSLRVHRFARTVPAEFIDP